MRQNRAVTKLYVLDLIRRLRLIRPDGATLVEALDDQRALDETIDLLRSLLDNSAT